MSHLALDTILWSVFGLVILALVTFDLYLLRTSERIITVREALLWSFGWMSLAIAFAIGIYLTIGKEKSLQFITGYLVELSLSVDNLFVFYLIFAYFRVPPIYQRKVLFWGILGALIMRAIFIGGGAILIEKFAWLTYLLGAFVVITGLKLLSSSKVNVDPSKNPILNLLRKITPITPDYREGSMFVRENGRISATPLFVALVAIETTDLAFATDSVPAIFSITLDPLIIYTSNIFAILGLRSIYFALSGLAKALRYLDKGLAIILLFVGVKMLIKDLYHIPDSIALGIVGGILVISVIVSLILPEKKMDTTGVEH